MEAREALAQTRGALGTERLRIQQEGQLRRDELKQEGELRKLRVKTEADIRRKTTPTVAQDMKLRERSRKIRLADARKRISISQSGRGSPRDAMRAIRVLGEIDPDAARMLTADFERNPMGGIRTVRAGAVGVRPEPVPPSTTLALPRRAMSIEPSEATMAKAARPANLRKWGKRGLIGGAAAIGIPLLLKAMSGGEKKGGAEITPEIQMQLMQAMGGGQGGTDPNLTTGRQLRNVFQLLQIIKTLRDMQMMGAQPTPGGLV
jgi:hypothetical protein